ncbi:MAG: DUF5671 domain-containing protein [Patescibacteria group bacterium]
MELTQATPKASPRDVFLHLLAIITLYASATALIALLFQYIELGFPDSLRIETGGQYYRDSIYRAIRVAVATLIVVFPAYITASRFLGKIGRVTPEKRSLKIRKWLLYFTVFIAALIMLGDFVTLVYNLLNGESSISFFLKVLSVFLVAGSVFLYYLWDLHETSPSGKMKWFSYAVIVLVSIAVVCGFFAVGSPSEKRDRDFDAQRVGNLQAIQSSIVQYWRSKGRLPENLGVLADPLRYVTIPVDPQTKASYEYEVKGEKTFVLCADFKFSSALEGAPAVYMPSVELWDHASGRFCFERSIDADFFKDKSMGIEPSFPR